MSMLDTMTAVVSMATVQATHSPASVIESAMIVETAVVTLKTCALKVK